MDTTEPPPRGSGRPPKQENLQRAIGLGFERLADQTDEQVRWLGGQTERDVFRVPVLEDVIAVDRTARHITATAAGRPVGPQWSILVLHYLAIRTRPEQLPPQVTFADLPTARSYAGVYQGRVIARLCGTAGRTAEKLTAAAEALRARPVQIDEGDLAYDFDLFPRLTHRLIWHAPDDEFPASATLLLPPNVEEYLCSEDVVVLSESLVARLGGRPF
jgi:hypothetical protein